MNYQANGANLHYNIQTATPQALRERSVKEPPLLWLHGALGSSAEFHPFALCFEERDCILLDLPGHGASSAPQSSISAQTLAQMILDFLQHLHIAPVDIIGYSLGGYIALEMALRSPTHVRSIISHAMKFYWTPEAIEEALKATNWETTKQNAKRAARLEQSHSAMGAAKVFELNRELISHFREEQLTHDQLRTLQQPLLLSVGDRDELVPLAEALKLYQALGYDRSSFAVHSNCPHALHKLSVRSFERAARQFWSEMI